MGGAVVKSALIAAFFLIAGLGVSACDTLMVPSTRPISKIESRALPEEALIRRVVGQLGNILHAIPPAYPFDHPVTPLDQILFWTTPHATETPRICGADLVGFDFTPARKDQPDASTPTRVSGVWAEARYRYVPEAPGASDAEPTPEEADLLQTICSKLDPYESRFFVARSEDYALRAAHLYESVLQEAVNAPQKFTFHCYPVDPECRNTFPEIPFTVFSSVGDCSAAGEPPGDTCTKYESGGMEILEVQVRTTGYGSNVEILAVDVSWDIYMSSVRID